MLIFRFILDQMSAADFLRVGTTDEWQSSPSDMLIPAAGDTLSTARRAQVLFHNICIRRHAGWKIPGSSRQSALRLQSARGKDTAR